MNKNNKNNFLVFVSVHFGLHPSRWDGTATAIFFGKIFYIKIFLLKRNSEFIKKVENLIFLKKLK